ncbi:MurR/RpiR family transcriptional regulator [Maritalea porphyrae]|jgi:DNA-binding MurR/RpiR family transcriptional regulator|uniref:MurR/RpiR family transcriptional regulator n=2 Tax=Maritalea TaxID=623276 RepID=UPI0022B07967|nr:MurR/RpiR family transcriptional regulator [Maritalea porphyrae]MCZ4271681.1 MurR/RpiR family transcriptional regulator [Maritalea porphyrae]
MTVRVQIAERAGEFTANERKLSATILADYPFAGLAPIQVLAEKTNVSAPTISRFVSKLGYGGFQDFQQQLIAELKEGQKSPVDLHSTRRQVEGDYLVGFFQRAEKLLSETSEMISAGQFERVCALLSDDKRGLYLIGGRMSDPIVQYLSRHLRQYRANVFHLPSDPEVWPEYLLRMRPKDILVTIDFRRYQNSLQELAQLAVNKRGAGVVLVTDKWMSPISKLATEVLPVPIDSGTVWDSYAAALTLVEAIVARVTENNWEQTRKRIEAWDSTRLDFEAQKNDE